MINSDLFDPINELVPFMEYDICDENILRNIKRINENHIEKLLHVLCDQNLINISNIVYSIYKMDIHTFNFSHHIDIIPNGHGQNHTSIQSELNYLLLHILSPESMALYLTENISRNKRYTFMPITFGHEYTDSGHMTSLIFDNREYKVYLYDPNGRSTYFNTIYIDAYLKNGGKMENSLRKDMYVSTENLLNALIKSYVDELYNKYRIKYEFIPSNNWNKNDGVLNKNFKKSVIGNGHCVIITIMFLHYLSITEDNVENIFNKLTNVCDEELLYIINCYSMGIYNNFIKYIY